LKQFSVFHPFLFAIFPILFLFAYNIDEVPATDLLLPMLVVIIGTLILLLSLRLITKSYNKIAIIASSFLILFFSAGYIRDLISSEIEGGFSGSIFFWGPLWALLFITGGFLVIKARSNFFTLTKFLNVVAITLVIISLVNISIYEIKTIILGQEEIHKEGNGFDLDNLDSLPDIYYIILDGYAGEYALKQIYNYDNSEFTDYLTNKGFYIASRSRSNYGQTVESVASSLNMEYVNDLKSSDIYEMLPNNKVSQFLKSRGYRYIFITTGFFPKGMSKYAETYPLRRSIPELIFSDFTTHLIKTTALAPLVYFITALTSTPARSYMLLTCDMLADMPNIKEPTFVYAHIMAPHPPYIFDRDGNPVSMQDNSFENKEGYLGQLIFISKKVETLVDEILSKSDVEPIIILQGDHGPKLTVKALGIPNSEFIKFNILNAYYLPGKDNRLLYETITPVNSFRIVFNLYFDTDYELLKDESQ